VQETKIDKELHESLKDCFAAAGFTFCHYTSSLKKGYAGVALYSRTKPLSIVDGIGHRESDEEGRCITAEFEDCIVCNVYVPNSGVSELERLDYRSKTWDPTLRAHLAALKAEKKKPVILIGDLNVAFHDMDTHSPEKARNKTAGFVDAERDGFAELLKMGFRDVWRERNPTTQQFTYYSPRFGCRAKNAGWRLDYALVDEALVDRVEEVFVRDAFPGTDHLPIGLVLKKAASS
jgi:exodeoxyribonuclease III